MKAKPSSSPSQPQATGSKCTVSIFFTVVLNHKLLVHLLSLDFPCASNLRLSLIESKTVTLDLNLDNPDVQIEDIDDIPCLQCLDALKSGNASSRTGPVKLDRLEPPVLIQFRMFHNGRAAKGTILINKKLRGKRIQIRPSVIKVERDDNMYDTPTVNSFETVSTKYSFFVRLECCSSV